MESRFACAAPLLFVEFLLAGFVEVKRWQDIRSPGSQAEPGSFLGFESSLKGKEVGYPGGPFDPLGLCRVCALRGQAMVYPLPLAMLMGFGYSKAELLFNFVTLIKLLFYGKFKFSLLK